jgi:micrococcal nuclease
MTRKIALVSLLCIVLAVCYLSYVIEQAYLKTDTTEAEVSVAALEDVEGYQVLAVLDGDTIDVLIDGETARVRYIGIDAPERGFDGAVSECQAEEALRRNEVLVANQMVRLVKDISEYDQYGRLLRYVYVGEEMINALLVTEGYAKAVVYEPDTEYRDELRAREREAMQARLGVWSELCTQSL